MCIHARAGGPALALHLEERLVRVIAHELELLEPWFEAELGERGRDDVGGACCFVAARRPRADLRGQGGDQIHAASLGNPAVRVTGGGPPETRTPAKAP